MKHVRIVIGAVPEILREILSEVLASEPGFEVVHLANGVLPEDIAWKAPDLVVTMIDNGVPKAFREFFKVYPNMRLLGLKSHGRNAFLVELQPQKVSLGELSSEDLVVTIREAASRPDFVSSLAEI
jgi:DNA-binding NarL/FixJ family response regulator